MAVTNSWNVSRKVSVINKNFWDNLTYDQEKCLYSQFPDERQNNAFHLKKQSWLSNSNYENIQNQPRLQ